jgi:hypothetical protein
MFRGVSVKNFKAFGEGSHLWDMRQLTCLCGPNASGKSSVIQSLLALRQSVEASIADPASPLLVVDGSIVSLGNFSDILHAHDLSRTMQFQVAITQDDTIALVGLGFRNLELLNETRAWDGAFRRSFAEPALAEITIDTFEKSAAATVVFHLGLTIDREDYYRGYFQDATGFAMFPTRDIEDQIVECGEFSFAGYQFGQGYYLAQTQSIAPARSTHQSDFMVADGETALWKEFEDVVGDPSAENIIGYANGVLAALADSLVQTSYIGPQREVPQRYYPRDQASRGRLATPELGADWREILARGRVPWYYKYDEPTIRDVLPPGAEADFELGRLDLLLAEWLRYLGLPEVVPSLEGRDLRLFARSAYSEECLVSLTDTGYGVSQVLPILVQGLTLDGGTLVLDQPELHLHPRLQTGMADFALTVARENGAVVVETHSDHFINRVVRRIVEGWFPADDVAIHFFTPTVDGPHVEKVNIDPTFGIRNWPLGFFDQYADEQEAVIRASLKRRLEEGRQ